MGILVRVVAGIMGKGSKAVTPVYKNMSAGNVIPIPKITKFQQNAINKMKTDVVNERKSGGFAKNAANQMQGYYKSLGGPKKPTVKINSGK